MPDWDKILAQVAVVTNAPIPFFIALFIMAGLIWWAMNWRYSTIVENKDSEIALARSQRDDYKDKLSGATPDQAKARIDALEGRLAAVEPRRLTTEQRAKLISRLMLSAGEALSVNVVSESAGDSMQYASDFVQVFKSAGSWKIDQGGVLGVFNRTSSGLTVQTTDPEHPPRATLVVMAALRAANIQFDIQNVFTLPVDAAHILITAKISP